MRNLLIGKMASCLKLHWQVALEVQQSGLWHTSPRSHVYRMMQGCPLLAPGLAFPGLYRKLQFS